MVESLRRFDFTCKLRVFIYTCPQCSHIEFCSIPCMFRNKCLFKSTTSFMSGQWVHCIRRWTKVLCITRASIVSNSSWHIRILQVNAEELAFRWPFAFFFEFLFKWIECDNFVFCFEILLMQRIWVIYFDFVDFLLVFLFALLLTFGLTPFFSCFTVILAISSFGVSNSEASWKER